MLTFSSESIIEYSPEQITQSLTLTNPTETQILFKVKTNNIKAIDARPNIGSIGPGANFKIAIKRNQHIDEGVKLQISYLECSDLLTKENFKDLWAKNDKGQQSKTFLIKVTGKAEDKKEEVKDSKKPIDRFNSVLSSGDSDPNLFQSVRVSRKTTDQFEAVKAQSKQPEPQVKPKEVQKQQVAQKLAQQKASNKILTEKLNERENQLKGSELKQISVQKFLSSPSCKRPHYPYSVLAVLALIIFGLGFYFGHSVTKSDL